MLILPCFSSTLYKVGLTLILTGFTCINLSAQNTQPPDTASRPVTLLHQLPYPCPKGILNLKAPMTGLLTMHTLKGTPIFSKRIKHAQKIDLSKLPLGVYRMVIVTEGNVLIQFITLLP